MRYFLFVAIASLLVPFTSPSLAANAVLLLETSGVQIWSDISYVGNGLIASEVSLRSADPDATDIVTFDGIEITGPALHQVGIPDLFGTTTTPTIDDINIIPEWVAADSHFLIPDSWVKGGTNFPVYSMFETNDESNPHGLNEQLPTFRGMQPSTGFGQELRGSHPSDAFFIGGDEANKDDIPFVRLVVPLPTPSPLGAGPILANLEMNVLGEGFDPIALNLGIPFAQTLGWCDENEDDECDLRDLELLRAQADGQLFVEQWLWGVGADWGDTDLDGDIDVIDLNAVGVNWLSTEPVGWAGGDFNNDGIVDSMDLNEIAIRWQNGVDQPAAVPEPSGFAMLFPLLAMVCALRRLSH